MIDHTCRDEGYSPYVAPCRGCSSQLSINGAERSGIIRRNEAERHRQLVELRAKAPLRSKGRPVEDAAHLPLFVAGNEPRFL